MNARERGFLLLSSHLEDVSRRVLTGAQLRELALRIQAAPRVDASRELEEKDLLALGYGSDMAQRILQLLSEEDRLDRILRRGRVSGCIPLSRVSEEYPLLLRKKLGLDSPGCLWCRGELSLLGHRAISLVGSRELAEPNAAFAREVGRQAALQGWVLVSGNARGADQAAQRACLEAGGKVISVVADTLGDRPREENILYISEDGFDLPFSAQRALSRNRIIHALGQKVFVAQCSYQVGGTWSGTVKNLRFGWSPVYCFADGSPAMALLTSMGATGILQEQLQDFTALPEETASLLNGGFL